VIQIGITHLENGLLAGTTETFAHGPWGLSATIRCVASLDLQLMSLSIRRLIPSFDNTQLRPRQRSKGKGAVACFTFVRAKVQLKATGERQ